MTIRIKFHERTIPIYDISKQEAVPIAESREIILLNIPGEFHHAVESQHFREVRSQHFEHAEACGSLDIDSITNDTN